MSYSAQYRQFLISYREPYGCEPSPDEIAAFHARHNKPTDRSPVIGEERTENAGTRDTVRSSFQTAGPP